MPINNDHIQPFTAKSIVALDKGAVGAEIDRQLGVLCQDINSRPMNAELKPTPARVLTVKLKLSPVLEKSKQDGSVSLVAIAVEPDISGSSPNTIGGKTDVRMRRGRLVYNTEVPENFEQLALPYSDSPKEDSPAEE